VAIAWNNLTGRTHDLAGPANRPTRVDPKQDVPPPQRKRKAG